MPYNSLIKLHTVIFIIRLRRFTSILSLYKQRQIKTTKQYNLIIILLDRWRTLLLRVLCLRNASWNILTSWFNKMMRINQKICIPKILTKETVMQRKTSIIEIAENLNKCSKKLRNLLSLFNTTISKTWKLIRFLKTCKYWPMFLRLTL